MLKDVITCAGALRAIVDVMNTLAAAAVATQMIVLGGSVFLPSGSKSSTGSAGSTAPARAASGPYTPLTLVKQQSSNTATALKAEPEASERKMSKQQLGVASKLWPQRQADTGLERMEAKAQQAEIPAPQAAGRGSQNFLQMLLPSDSADRKVSSN